jgi:hypothetical protein
MIELILKIFTYQADANYAILQWKKDISAGLGFLSANRQRREARRQFNAQQELRREQQKLLEQQKQEYRDIEFTNPYAGVQNPFAGLQTQFENVYEDLTVNQQQAQFQAQRGMQQRANILQNLRGAAGGSGIASLAQSLANQGQIQAQQISASIGQQEAANQRLAARGAMQVQQMEAAREQQIAQGAFQADMAVRGGEAMLQQAEMSRQATLLGMQYGETSGANMAYQQALRNRQAADASANQMMIGGMQSLMSTDFSAFGGGGGNVGPANQYQTTVSSIGDYNGNGIPDYLER